MVFGCQDGHSLCVPCFIEYCRHQLVNRQFIQDRVGKGYTIRCPASCPGSEITEIHHFRLMGKNSVSNVTKGFFSFYAYYTFLFPFFMLLTFWLLDQYLQSGQDFVRKY